jgi:hypothetical protein
MTCHEYIGIHISSEARSPRPAPASGEDSGVSVLAYWRLFGADDFTPGRRARVRNFVERAAIIDEPRWKEAARGDGAAAIGIAISRRPAVVPDLRFDVAMTAVLHCALRGDAAAAVVLAGTVRRYGDRPRSAAVAAMWDNANRILDAEQRGPSAPRAEPSEATGRAMIIQYLNDLHIGVAAAADDGGRA